MRGTEAEKEARAALRCTWGAVQAIKAARRRDLPVDFTIDTWECGTDEMRLVRLVDSSHRVEARRPGEQWRSLEDDRESLAARIQQLRQLLGLPPTL